MMDDQSFELLVSKLDSIEATQRQMQGQIDDRLRQHFDLFQQHTEEDRKLADHIMAVDKEVTFAKGVTYAVNAVSATIAWMIGWSK